ncbi:virulence factor SrfC family protein [Citrobacter tructae]|uniref:virulence factor SrfC family protein n=1 Tax=Citrobacter tructae TaxID=2562449 RepID=UPI003F55FAEC
MSTMLNTTQAAIAWVNRTRQHAVRLDDEADALLMQLNTAAVTESALNAAHNRLASIGLYGYSQAAKAHLLASLCGDENGKLNIVMPDRNFDYFNHINPGHAATNMALRFTRQENPLDREWPLRLRLITEAELVQIFIALAALQPEIRQVETSIIESRLEKWQALRQPHPMSGVSTHDVVATARFWRSCVPSSSQQIDDALWHQFAMLIPTVDLSTRASAWSLLWGEQPELTQQWLKLAHVLQQTGHAQEVAAPLSLLVDQFGLPAESFITQDALATLDAQSDVVVHPVIEQQRLNAVSLPLEHLAMLTREVVLTVEDGMLDNVDLLDIPLAPLNATQPLWHAKLGWLLEHYRQQLQPDVLMICNATVKRTQTTATARTLLNWVHDTQPSRETALPGVVWAITPLDARFSTQQNLDEAVQQLMGKPGQHWGTLQALDKHSLQRLVEWLSQATSPTQHQARLQALREQHHQHLRALFSAKPDEQLSAETVIRQLQNQAAHHGDLLAGLLPAVQQFEALLRIQQPREEQVSGLFNDAIDLFAEVRETPQQAESKDAGYLAHKMWLNHIRQWSRDGSQAQRLGLTPATLHRVVDILITTSYRLDLPQQLQQIMQREEVCGAQLHACIANFIAWLGYADVAEAARPASRIMKGAPIFCAVKRQPMSRLTQLEAQPVHAASRYVYDWLVALYTRANENKGYQHPQDVTDADKKALNALLARG